MTRTPDTDDELPFVDFEAPSDWQTDAWDRIQREGVVPLPPHRRLCTTLAVLGCAVVGAVLGVALLAAIIALGGWP